MRKKDEKIFRLPIRLPSIPPGKSMPTEKDYNRKREKSVEEKDYALVNIKI